MADEDLRKKARRRALRAAKVVTLGMAMAGCGSSHTNNTSDAAPPARDARPPIVDASTPTHDLATPAPDLGRDMGQDLGQPVDMAVACPADPWTEPPTTPECCELAGGWWDESVDGCLLAVPGPFVPPSMRA